jgi:hypothetical protein
MKRNSTLLDLVIGAALKLDSHTSERQNTLAFIESCYGGLVRNYDLGAALASLRKLTEQEHHALIEWTVNHGQPVPAKAKPAKV